MNLNLGDTYAILTAFCWSSAVILFDVSSRKLSSLQMNVIKNFIGVIGFIGTIIILNIPIPKLVTSDLIILIVSGFLGVAIADLFFLSSLTRLGSGLAAIVSTIYSPAIFLFSFLMFNETISIQAYFGAILVIGGIFISTFKVPTKKDKNTIIMGVLFGLIAQVLTAYSVLLVKPIMENNSIIIIALIRFSIGLIITAGFLIFKTNISELISTLKNGLTNVTIVSGSILGTFLSVIFWLAGFKYTLAGRAAIYNQLSTVLIMILAVIFLKESMSYKKWIGILLSVSGALLVSYT
jgi:drug/metabolite transporter (DMT)-like permease